MDGFIKKIGILAVALCLFLTGCGQELWSMTPEEEDLIVAYVSSAVAKNNKYLAQGITYDKKQEAKPEPGQEEPPQQQTAPSEEAGSPQGDVAGSSASQQGQTEPAAPTVTLTEALGLAPLTVECIGYQVTDRYVEGSYFALQADAGNRYVVLRINLTNPTQQKIECNNLVRNITWTLLVNGTHSAGVEPTILLNDFATYLDTLDPGVTKGAILLFEVPADVAGNIQAMGLQLDIEGKAYYVSLFATAL